MFPSWCWHGVDGGPFSIGVCRLRRPTVRPKQRWLGREFLQQADYDGPPSLFRRDPVHLVAFQCRLGRVVGVGGCHCVRPSVIIVRDQLPVCLLKYYVVLALLSQRTMGRMDGCSSGVLPRLPSECCRDRKSYLTRWTEWTSQSQQTNKSESTQSVNAERTQQTASAVRTTINTHACSGDKATTTTTTLCNATLQTQPCQSSASRTIDKQPVQREKSVGWDVPCSSHKKVLVLIERTR